MATALTVGGWFAQATIQTLLDRLSSSAIQAYKSHSGLGDALDSLKISLLKVNVVLNGRPKRHGKEDVESLNELLKLLKEAAYDAEDLIGELEYENLKLEREGDPSSSSLGDTLLEFARGFLDDKTTKVLKVQEKLNNIIAGLRDVLQVLSNVDGRQQVENDRERPETSSFLTEPEVVGRDREKDELIKLLLNSGEGSRSNNTSIHVISIVGIGGVGKTTLVQSVYNDDDSMLGEYFQEKIWICASDPFDVKRLTKDLVGDGDMKQPELANLARLQRIVKEKLESKKFLLVIDDVWNENKSKWESFCAPLRFGAPGSKILVTSRSHKVAETIGAKDIIDLKGLEDELYWQFFKKCAFGDEDSKKNYPKLEEIGKKIAGRLKGIPLAAKTLGSLLESDKDEEQWKTIMESELWNLMQNENDILPVLKLSYDYLPPCLKQCFAYCSLFPKDFKFEKDTLVQMWMAQGFITSQRKLLMEDVGRGYVKDLLSRGLFEQNPYYDGEMMMHDLLHDLAQSISKDECYRIDDSNKPQMIPHRVYHLSVCDPNLEPDKIINICNKHKKLRTLLFVCEITCDLSVEELDQLLCGLTCMRVLVLKEYSVAHVKLPDGIGDLKQLRYLDVSHTNVRELPESLCRLYNLQVLKVYPKLPVSFPKGVRNLISLRHLSAKEYSVSMIANIGRLTSLHNLSLFSIRKKHGYMIEELKNMIELRGNLRIEHLENIDSKEEASKAKLDNKMYLKELWLEWADERHTDLGIEISDAVILEGLRPHSNLEELNIVNYGGKKCPSWLESQFLSNLVSISLINCKHMVRLPPLGQLPYLKVLELEGLNAVKEVGEELYGTTRQSKAFPLLKILWLNNMPEWEKWSLGYSSQMFPCLEEIVIMNCPKMKVLPMLPPKVERLEIIEVGVDAFPSLGHLSHLKTLHYGGLVGVRKVEDLFGGTESTGFPSLEELKFEDMPELEEWSGAYGSHLFPCLKKVYIISCPKLRNLPFCLPPSLVRLYLHEVGLDALPGIWAGSDVESSCSRRYQSASLSKVYVSKCPNLKSLEQWLLPNQLTDLHELTIANCGALTSLPIEKFKAFSSLKKLKLINMPELGELSGAYGSHIFPPCLVKVSIRRCPKLRNLPFCLPPSLVKLKLEEVGLDALPGIWVGSEVDDDDDDVSQESSGYHQSASLSEVDILNCPNLKSVKELLLPNQLPSLKKMSIIGCGELTSLPIERFKDLSSFESLMLRNCPKLAYAVEAAGEEEQNNLLFPSSLKEVELGGCGDLDRALLLLCLRGANTYVYRLALTDCEHITSFPGEYEYHMTKLEFLKLKGLTELKTLNSSLRCFKNLKELKIEDCPQLKAIPEDSLPSSLRVLRISNCHPDLKERCQKDTGDDWPKIAHIPNIRIDGEWICWS